MPDLDIVYAIPCANPTHGSETLAKWKARGYRTAVLVDGETPAPANADVVHREPIYKGYGWANNLLVELLPGADIYVFGGHDIDPDPDHDPQAIGRECIAKFGGTFFVMQPTGDPWIDHCIRHFCGSPWIGREFAKRAYGGRGPYWPEYFHYYDDTELQNIAIRERCFWQREDLSQVHSHWSKSQLERPEYLIKTQPRVASSRELFGRRRAAGFPGSKFLAGSR